MATARSDADSPEPLVQDESLTQIFVGWAAPLDSSALQLLPVVKPVADRLPVSGCGWPSHRDSVQSERCGSGVEQGDVGPTASHGAAVHHIGRGIH